MVFFAKTKPADQPQVRASAGKRIVLKSRRFSEEAIRAMAEQTLTNGGFVAAPLQPKNPIQSEEPIEPCIGDKMPDGAVFAGVSPDSGKAFYAMPTDATLTMTFIDAQRYAQEANMHGHSDWRVPTKNELNVLFNNRAAIGRFDVSGSYPSGWYWSSSSSFGRNAWEQRFSDGCQFCGMKDGHSSVRLVR